MSTVNVPNAAPNNVFSVLDGSTIYYNNFYYTGVTDIAYPDGTHQTCAQAIVAAGGTVYGPNELKGCVKVEGVDPDTNGRQIFSIYSSNSRQTSKNNTSIVPGGMWVEMFDFRGFADDSEGLPVNGVLKLWKNYFGSIYATQYAPTWLGFKMNYGTSEAHSYVQTQVNDFLEESVPSPPSNIGVTYMHDAQLNGLWTPPAPVNGALYVPIRSFKLYRAAITSSGGYVYQRVPVTAVNVTYGLNLAFTYAGADFPHSAYLAFPPTLYAPFYTTTWGYQFVDNVTQDKLLETLPSLDWDAPPTDLQGLTAYRNGIMAAFKDATLYFCEPYRPFTFPTKYAKSLPWKIVGIRADENTLIVITEGEPYIFMGSHPANITYERLQNVQAGVRSVIAGAINPARALTRTPNGVVYASREGLVSIKNGIATMLGRSLFTRDEWLTNYGPYLPLMRLSYYDGKLMCYFDNAPTVTGFIVNMLDGDPQFTRYTPTSLQTGEFVMPLTDSLYVVNYAAPVSTINRFADENVARIPCTYWTRDVITPKPENMAALQVVGTGFVIATVYADGVALPSITFNLSSTNPGQAFARLPGGYKARRWSVYLALGANAVVSEVNLAGNLLELRNV